MVNFKQVYIPEENVLPFSLLYSKKKTNQLVGDDKTWKPKVILSSLRLKIRCRPLSKHPLPPARHLPCVFVFHRSNVNKDPEKIYHEQM